MRLICGKALIKAFEKLDRLEADLVLIGDNSDCELIIRRKDQKEVEAISGAQELNLKALPSIEVHGYTAILYAIPLDITKVKNLLKKSQGVVFIPSR